MTPMPAFPSSRRAARRPARGFTLVELLVAIALGLFIVIALIALYVNVIRSNNEMSKTNQLIENGRFAMQILQEDVALAGFWGPIEQLEATAVPDPCAAYPGAWTAAHINNVLAVPVLGFQDGSPYAACGAGLASVVARSDVLFVTRASTCTVGAGCEGAGDEGPHIQVSDCRAGPIPEPSYFVATTDEMDATPLRKRSCVAAPVPVAEQAPRRKLVSNIYYVANSASGVPTLMRMSYVDGEYGPGQALVEGIEAFQAEFGIDDLGSNGLPISATNPADGNADRYQSCTTATPCDLADLANVVSVKLHLLVRNLEPTAGYTDAKAYEVGPLAVPAANDAYKRHVFTTTVRLVNPSSRREKP